MAPLEKRPRLGDVHSTPGPQNGLDSSAMPPQELVGPWLVPLVAKVAESSVLNTLYGCCKAGKDWVLISSPRATLRLDSTKGQSQREWQAQWQANKQAMAKRGTLPTAVEVLADGTDYSSSVLDLAASNEDVKTSRATELIVTAKTAPYPIHNSRAAPSITRFLASGALWAVTRVKLDVPCDYVLPHPVFCPNIKHMTLVLDKRFTRDIWYEGPVNFLVSVSKYVAQLQSISVYGLAAADTLAGPWLQIFSAAAPSTELTSISTDGALKGPLLQCILSHAPALSTLRVRGVRFTSGDVNIAQGREWAVETMVCERWVCSTQLACLPRAAMGRVMFTAPELKITQLSAEGLEPAPLRERLSDYTFNVDRVLINDHNGLDVGQNLSALTHVLQQIKTLHTTDKATVDLDWAWSAQTAVAVANALPTLNHLRFSIRVDQLNDDTLTYALHMGGVVRQMAVGWVGLQEDTHVGGVWPWDGVRVTGRVGLMSMLNMPNPAERGEGVGGERGAPVLDVQGCVTMQNGTEAHVPRLREWLTHVRFQRAHFALGPETHPKATSLLHAVRFTNPQALHTATVRLENITFTPETFDTLSHLPTWDGATLHIGRDCKWPCEAGAYRAFGAHVPVEFVEWVFEGKVDVRVLERVCEGANRQRKGLRLPVLSVCVDKDAVVPEGTWEHVRIDARL